MGGGKPFRVMLVEDDADLREVLTEILEDCGYVVYAFTYAEAAVLALREGVRPDVAVVDVGLPGVNGAYFVSRVMEKFSSLPCILTSATKHTPPPGVPFLLKPFDVEDLVNHIAEAIMVGQYGATLTAG